MAVQLKNKMTNHSVIRIIFLTFFAVVILSIVVSLAIYRLAATRLREEIINSSSMAISQVKDTVDSTLEKTRDLFFQLVMDKNLRRFRYNPNVDELKERYYSLEIIQELSQNILFHPYLENTYCFYEATDVVLDKSSILQSADLYDQLFSHIYPTYRQWLDWTAAHNNQGAFLSLPSQGDNGKIIFCGRDSFQSTDISIFLVIDAPRLLQPFEDSFLTNNITTAVLDEKNQIICSTGPMEASRLPVSYPSMEGIADTSTDIITYTKSQVLDYTYITIYPKQIFWAKLESIRSLNWLLIMLYAAIACVIVLFFTAWNKQQLNTLVSFLAGNVGLPFRKGGNEFRFIREAFTAAVSRRDLLEQRLRQQNNLVRQNYLTQLLKGTVGWASFSPEESNEAFNLQLKDTCFSVMMYYIEEIENQFYDESYQDDENIRLMQFVISNVTEEYLSQAFYACSAVIENNLFTIVNLPEASGEEQLLQMRHLIAEAKDILKRKFSISITVSVSGCYSKFAGIHSAWTEALQAMEYRYFTPGEVIVRPADAKGDQDGYPVYPLLTEQQLIGALKSGDQLRAEQIVSSTLDQAFQVLPGEGLDYARFLAYDMAGTVVKALQEIKQLYPAQDGIYHIQPLCRATTLEQFRGEMLRAVTTICEAVNGQKQQKSSNIGQEVLAYLQAHYENPDLNVTYLGEQFQMSPFYLSRLFKESAGDSILDVLCRIRIEQAKKLLTGDLNANEIAARTGFHDYHTFARTFKKLEGISPKAYRELHRQNQ